MRSGDDGAGRHSYRWLGRDNPLRLGNSGRRIVEHVHVRNAKVGDIPGRMFGKIKCVSCPRRLPLWPVGRTHKIAPRLFEMGHDGRHRGIDIPAAYSLVDRLVLRIVIIDSCRR